MTTDQQRAMHQAETEAKMLQLLKTLDSQVPRMRDEEIKRLKAESDAAHERAQAAKLDALQLKMQHAAEKAEAEKNRPNPTPDQPSRTTGPAILAGVAAVSIAGAVATKAWIGSDPAVAAAETNGVLESGIRQKPPVDMGETRGEPLFAPRAPSAAVADPTSTGTRPTPLAPVLMDLELKPGLCIGPTDWMSGQVNLLGIDAWFPSPAGDTTYLRGPNVEINVHPDEWRVTMTRYARIVKP